MAAVSAANKVAAAAARAKQRKLETRAASSSGAAHPAPSSGLTFIPLAPAAVRWAALGAALVLWWDWVPAAWRVQAVLGACAFSGIEFTWYSTTVLQRDGSVKFAPFSGKCQKGFTSPQQWWIGVVFIPMLLQGYPAVVHAIADTFGLSDTAELVVRLVGYPLNLWFFEIVTGYILMALYGGHNPAWAYKGPGTAFHGNVVLSHGILWWLLGVLVELTRPYITTFSEFVAVSLHLA